jgi:hypothetical protein
MIGLLRRTPSPPPSMTLEGVLGPNTLLDEAEGMAVNAPDALAVLADGRLVFSAGVAVLALDAWGAEPKPFASFAAPVTGLATSPGGLVAVGLAGGAVHVLDPKGQPLDWPQGDVTSVADLLFLSEEELAIVDPGYPDTPAALAMAPWDDESRGRVIALTQSGQSRALAAGLHSPMGLCREGNHALLVTELDRARVIDTQGKLRQSGYPGYLGRLRPSAGGYLLTGLARRDPLIDFLKTEPAFIAEMKATIDPRHWISPRLSPALSHDFPIESGATRLFGLIKPWAPSFSYGLVMWLDRDLMPVGSAQSRANGRRHGISDALSWQGQVIAVSRGSSEILNLGPERPAL